MPDQSQNSTYFRSPSVIDLMFASHPPNSYVETLPINVTELGSGAFGRQLGLR